MSQESKNAKGNPISASQDWIQLKNFLSSKPELNSYLKNLDNIEVEVTKYLSAITDMKLELNKSKQDIIDLTNGIRELKNHHRELITLVYSERKKRIAAECQALSNTIILYGLPIHKKALSEKREEGVN